MDTIFAPLADADGEEDGNLFWIKRPRENTDFKLALQASQVKESTERAMRLLLDEGESPFIGGKVMVSSGTLIILYLRGDFALGQDLLHGIVECCDAVPFVPITAQPRTRASSGWATRTRGTAFACPSTERESEGWPCAGAHLSF